MRFIALQQKSTETKIINISLAGTGRQAYRKTRQARREEKKWQERKKKRCGFIMFGIESAAAGCDIPNNTFTTCGSRRLLLRRRHSHAISIQLVEEGKLERGSSPYQSPAFIAFILHLRRNIYASANFTTRFPGHTFCCASRQVEKDDKE